MQRLKGNFLAFVVSCFSFSFFFRDDRRWWSRSSFPFSGSCPHNQMNFVNSNCFVRRTSDGPGEQKKTKNKQCMVYFRKVLFSFFYEQHLHGQHFLKYRTKKKQKSRWWVKAKTSHHQTNNTPVCFFLCVSLMDILSRADFYTQSFTIIFFSFLFSRQSIHFFFLMKIEWWNLSEWSEFQSEWRREKKGDD